MENKSQPEHHKQLQLCATRAQYRQGKKLTAVKVYTVAQESPHLFVYGVPKIKLRQELKSLCSKYGVVLSIHVLENVESDIFTECYHVQYDRIQSARVAKRALDTYSFYGSILHVGYAPEFESIHETRAKLLNRKYNVLKRICNDYTNEETAKVYKRKHTDDKEICEILDPRKERRASNRHKSDLACSSIKTPCISTNNEFREKVFGPQLPEIPPKEPQNFMPSCVLRSKLKLDKFNDCSNKRIVFRNKK